MAKPITLCLTIGDGKGLFSQTLINFPSLVTTDIGGQYDSAETFTSLVDALISGYIARIGLVVDIPLPLGIKTEADPNADIEEGAKFIWRSQDGFTSENRIPTFNEDFIVPSTTQVNFVQEVMDFWVAMVAYARDSRDTPLDTLLFAQEDFGRSRT